MCQMTGADVSRLVETCLRCWVEIAVLAFLWCAGDLLIAVSIDGTPRTVRCRALDNTGAWTNTSDGDVTADACGTLRHALAGLADAMTGGSRHDCP